MLLPVGRYICGLVVVCENSPFWPPDFILNEVSCVQFHIFKVNSFQDIPQSLLSDLHTFAVVPYHTVSGLVCVTNRTVQK